MAPMARGQDAIASRQSLRHGIEDAASKEVVILKSDKSGEWECS
ncbi:hypothetical protein [Azospirillum picis]|uniref:Uncharacterized protein n=1 Tax=Azospirillum picis TaxID=488438 RepID=A0ABU0MHA2_9PROT|nr:hypothetical protein [Azospirillum picis]MBP2298951.1 hypothetical protein [Azospirillum picis]MDQ0532807.1 hypothetical protein [Azospirillum picis]